jgi:hypothetical protein
MLLSVMTAPKILAAVAGALAVISLFKPEWPMLPVAILLLAVAVFVK